MPRANRCIQPGYVYRELVGKRERLPILRIQLLLDAIV
jgi:hypothetical protein